MKRRVKKPSKPARIEVPQPFKDIKFDRSLIIILLAVLALCLSFVIYSNYNLGLPPETYGEITEEVDTGHECTADIDCAQPRCPGVKGVCKNGFCIVKQVSPSTVKCIDLKSPICGNNVCEGDEKSLCPEDC